MKIITTTILLYSLLLLQLNQNHFNESKMIQGTYLYTSPHPIDYIIETDTILEITLKNSLSKQFYVDYLNKQFQIKNYLQAVPKPLDTIEISNYLSKFFAIEIQNLSNQNYSIVHDAGLPIIQEAKDKNGEWKPIEYVVLSGNFLSHSIPFPSQSKIEIAAPRYSGEYETELRIKVGIQGKGVITSEAFKGTINYGQFKMPKSKRIKSRMSFLNH